MEKAEDYLRSVGAQNVSVVVNNKSTNLLKYYQNQSYQEIAGDYKVLFKDL